MSNKYYKMGEFAICNKIDELNVLYDDALANNIKIISCPGWTRTLEKYINLSVLKHIVTNNNIKTCFEFISKVRLNHKINYNYLISEILRDNFRKTNEKINRINILIDMADEDKYKLNFQNLLYICSTIHLHRKI